MNQTEAAKCLAELGHPTRLGVYRYLVRTGPAEVNVGDIQRELEVPASTLSHHLSRLARVGLIEQRRDGRVIYCRPQYERLQSIINFLTEECCQGQACIQGGSCC